MGSANDFCRRREWLAVFTALAFCTLAPEALTAATTAAAASDAQLEPAGVSSMCVFGDCQDGDGVFRYSNGDAYTGEWVGGLRDGVGVYTFKKGARYEGEFHSGKRSGFGRRTFDDGSSVWYSGQWQNGQWNGCGRANHPMLEEGDREGYFRGFRYVEARECAAEVALAEQYASQARDTERRIRLAVAEKEL